MECHAISMEYHGMSMACRLSFYGISLHIYDIRMEYLWDIYVTSMKYHGPSVEYRGIRVEDI